MDEIRDKILKSINKVERWVEDNDYKGYEPFDGLSSFLRPLTFGNLFLDRILLQLVRQSPINLRPLLGIKPLDSTIGMGYMAMGYLNMLRYTGNEVYKKKAVGCLDWLVQNKSPGYEDFSWGKHFDFAGRDGRYPKFEPITVWTSLIGQAFLDGYDILKEEKYLDIATSICSWILKLDRNETGTGICLSYTGKGDQKTSIHNHSMLGAAMLARTATYTNNEQYRRLAKEVMKFSCSRQLLHGGWYYGEAANQHWIDNFHTGYNLDALKCYMEYSGDDEYKENLKRGLKFYMDNFIEETGRPKYYHNRAYPIDSQCAAQAIDTFANFSEYDEQSLIMGLKVADWTINNMQDKDGHFYYRQYPFIKAKTPMLHWAEATTYKALTFLLFKMNYNVKGR